jgi:hypothetical protein
MHIVLQCTWAGGARTTPSAPSPPPRRPWPPARGRRRRPCRRPTSTAQRNLPQPTVAGAHHVHRPTQHLAAGEEGREGGGLERVGPRRRTSSLCCLLMAGSFLFLSLSA